MMLYIDTCVLLGFERSLALGLLVLELDLASSRCPALGHRQRPYQMSAGKSISSTKTILRRPVMFWIDSPLLLAAISGCGA